MFSHFCISSSCLPVPCKPTNVKASLQCKSNSAAVTFERASGALSYLSVGVTEDGSHRAECNNTVTHCDLSDLLCGQTYNVSVFAIDESCSSAESDTAYVRTGMVRVLLFIKRLYFCFSGEFLSSRAEEKVLMCVNTWRVRVAVIDLMWTMTL